MVEKTDSIYTIEDMVSGKQIVTHIHNRHPFQQELVIEFVLTLIHVKFWVIKLLILTLFSAVKSDIPPYQKYKQNVGEGVNIQFLILLYPHH